MPSPKDRPPFILSSADVPEKSGKYPNSDEPLAPARAIGRAAGLLRIGLHVQRVAPGQRVSWPHAEEDEEEFVYVLDGEIDAWVDGELHRMSAGDLAAFPAGTGICHTFLNNGSHEATLLVGGEARKPDSRIFYPLHPQRKADMPWSNWWDGAPARPQGPHDGKPDALRDGAASFK
ncbi:MAG: cupin domain-containing protein [Myxococcales bacterium]|nr:cupin domain-containing protein [Myxococcales bacterium]